MLYKNHQPDLLRRGIRNLSLFEAYLQYCFSPKHTVGEQLLDVRRDKRERAAFAAATSSGLNEFEEAEDRSSVLGHHYADRAASLEEGGSGEGSYE